jgi:uncharacterized protein YciI
MPHYIIHCLDKPDALPRRLEHYEAHRAYLQAATVKMIVSGPLMSDDGETMIGSCFLIEAPDKAAVQAFNATDPFAKAGIWASVSIHRFNKRVDNRD